MGELTKEDILREKKRQEKRKEILKSLTTTEKKFLKSYLDTKDCTKASLRANLSPSYGKQLLGTKRIRFAVAVMEAYYCQVLEINPESIVNHLKRIIDSNVYNIFTWDDKNNILLKKKEDLTPEICYAIDEMQVMSGGGIRVKLKDKLKAIDQLSKLEGLYRDRLEITGPDGQPLSGSGYDRPALEALSIEELKVYKALVEKMNKYKAEQEAKLQAEGNDL